MISIQNLSKQYSGQTIFDDVSLSINSQERIGLVGSNGHGKTTLFRLLTTQEMYDGSITFPKNYKIGYLEQHTNFSMPTILEEGCCGLPEDRKAETWMVEKILSGLGFSRSDFSRNPAEFSGGYQVRLHLTKALAAEPNLLLLDEPTNYLDIITIRLIILTYHHVNQ
ncbi:MAG: ATP-binding cassette domain-containing protein [bacterium]|nr:ATP-binding cassette domain-containing protein [bacterium]